MEGPSLEAFNAASQYFVDSVEKSQGADLAGTGLGAWTLLELIAHANRAHTTVEDYLLRPQAPEPRESGYFREEAIAQRGREAVAGLGADPFAAVSADAQRVRSLVARSSPDATIGSPMRTMTLAEYLPSRTAELTLHGVDIRRALGVELDVPGKALGDSLQFVLYRALDTNKGLDVLLALSGRAELSRGFSVY